MRQDQGHNHLQFVRPTLHAIRDANGAMLSGWLKSYPWSEQQMRYIVKWSNIGDVCREKVVDRKNPSEALHSARRRLVLIFLRQSIDHLVIGHQIMREKEKKKDWERRKWGSAIETINNLFRKKKYQYLFKPEGVGARTMEELRRSAHDRELPVKPLQEIRFLWFTSWYIFFLLNCLVFPVSTFQTVLPHLRFSRLSIPTPRAAVYDQNGEESRYQEVDGNFVIWRWISFCSAKKGFQDSYPPSCLISDWVFPPNGKQN